MGLIIGDHEHLQSLEHYCRDEQLHKLKINADRLWATLAETASFGGTLQEGVRRLALSIEDQHVRDWLVSSCKEVGCSVSVDEVGNMFALRPGSDTGALPIAVGSHLDTQPTGGRFDGILGVLSGLEIMRTLHDYDYKTRSPLMLVNWTNEEGARFAPAMLGSGVHAGVFDREFAYSREDADGIRFSDALEASGYRGSLPVGEQKFAAMFEVHIEQGPVLEREDFDIGIVTGVQAMRWYDLTITGCEAHAGTTPMNMRSDALMGAAHILIETERLAKDMGGLATIGQLSIPASSRNVVAGNVVMSIDLRHERDDVLEEMESKLRAILMSICGPDRARLVSIWESPAVRFDDGCLGAIRSGAYDANAHAREIVSGAGHDSVNISKIAPTAMIFIPCRDGLSHNPLEYASKDHCALGTQTLLNAVLSYDLMLYN
ncbi:Zn-dependent hydrolase [Ochrobactrum teleogrylli]|uniref:Zn-dependent hydrolase n=1 Tax=Ochrobactrum teleogrylli TaxID=2479765 RepID=UPI00384EE952